LSKKKFLFFIKISIKLKVYFKKSKIDFQMFRPIKNKLILDRMILLSKFCQHVDKEKQCDGRKAFGYFEEGVKLYCTSHKLKGMFNLTVNYCKTCIDIRSKDKTYKIVQANIGSEWHKPERCAKHKLEGDFHVMGTRCKHIFENGEQCKDVATVGVAGVKRKEYCSDHTLEGMIDKSHKKCIVCKKTN
jgi:hypothetical protein